VLTKVVFVIRLIKSKMIFNTNMEDMMSDKTDVRPPIMSGWKGDINGAVECTKTTRIKVTEVTICLDSNTAWALANQLTDRAIRAANAVEKEQITALSNLGAAIGRLIDHGAANNGGRECLK
jgi:hypothetical protein